jgi:ribosomal protein L7/L12
MDLENHVRAMLAQNERIEAIKWVLHQTGWGLKRSRDYVEEVARAMLSSLPTEAKGALEQEIGALVQQGARIEAIKRVRQATGWGLKECKDYVDQLSSSGPAGEAVPVPPLFRDSGLDLSQHTVSQIRVLLAEGHKVRAVQLVRTMANVGLREAKEYVDSLQARGGENEELIDEQQERAHLRAEAAHLVEEVNLLQAERAYLEGERDRLIAEQRRLRVPPQVPKRRKVGRNDPCPCGSGKKYKKCCGRRR